VLAVVGLALGMLTGAVLAALVPLVAASGYAGEVHEIADELVMACLVFGPLGGALLGLAGGAAGAIVYNAAARIVGGARVEIRPPTEPQKDDGPQARSPEPVGAGQGGTA
jgi:hypothetical protein